MNFFKKITSRKFVISILSVVGVIITAVFGHGSSVSTIMVGLSIAIPAVAYCIVEGRLDKKSMDAVFNAAEQTARDLKCSKELCDMIEKVGDLVNESISPSEESEGTNNDQ